MSEDLIRYDILAQQALRGLVRHVLTDVAKKGLPGEHHFFITFQTKAEGVRLSQRLIEQYPEEMTIVLQHQFWDLRVSDEAFEVGLSFGGVAERLHVPFAAIKSFVDPSVKFALQFETLAEAAVEQRAAPQSGTASPPRAADAARESATAARPPARREPAPAPAPLAAASAAQPKPKAAEPAPARSGAEIVNLDRFRKK
jgi:hypothetical protein